MERAHERYAEVVAEEVLDTEGDFLLTPSVALDEVEARMAVRVKILRSQEAKERLKQGVNGFAAPSKLILELCEAKEISMKDMRLELDKLETTYNGLQAELTLLDAGDHAELLAKYNKEVVDEYEKVRRSGLKYLNSEPTRPTIEPTDTEDGTMTVATRSAGFSTTKRETVMLPKFCGDEKSAFLQYPIWKKQWSMHITEYETKYRSTMLLNHLDNKALEQIVGYENEYDRAMEKLDHYYNDAKKIVKACLDEIRGHANINAHDYRALVNYKKCLVNNYTRLKACSLDQEMSNTAALAALVRKFPLHEAV